MLPKINNFLTFVVGFYMATIGCTTIERSQLKQVKRVAIIGFQGQIREGGDTAHQLGKAMVDQKFGPKLYQVALNQLSKSMNWKFVSRERLMNTPTYKKHAEAKSNKFADAVSKWDKQILVPGIFSAVMAAGLIDDRKRLVPIAKELGVDAVMTVDYLISPEAQTSLMSDTVTKMIRATSVSVHRLDCNLSIQLFDVRTGKKLWDQMGMKGQTSASPTASIFNIPFPDMKQRAVVSAFSNALAAHIREVKTGD